MKTKNYLKISTVIYKSPSPRNDSLRTEPLRFSQQYCLLDSLLIILSIIETNFEASDNIRTNTN